MPSYQTKNRAYQVGDYWLSQRLSQSPAWQITYYDKATSQTVRRSTSEIDLQKAKLVLDEFFIKNHRPQNASLEDVSVAQVLISYWEDHGKNVASAPSIKICARYCTDYWGCKSINDLRSRREQEGFQKWLRETKGLSDATINRTITTLKAACNLSWANGEILGVPKFTMLTITDTSPKGRPLEKHEVRSLLVNANTDHMRRFILLMLGTVSRPDAIFDLQTPQVDYERGLIHLNPKGRKQTKKRRPTVRLPHTLISILKEVEVGHYITYRGKPVKSVKGAWRRLRANAGLDIEVQPYSLRHTMARHL